MAGTDLATPADLRALLPALTDPPYSDALLQSFLDQTACLISCAEWGECCCYGHAYLTIHCLLDTPTTLAPNAPGGIGVGVVQAQTDGPASLTYATTIAAWTDPDDAELATSAWGRKYLRLRDSMAAKWGAALARRRSRWPA